MDTMSLTWESRVCSVDFPLHSGQATSASSPNSRDGTREINYISSSTISITGKYLPTGALLSVSWTLFEIRTLIAPRSICQTNFPNGRNFYENGRVAVRSIVCYWSSRAHENRTGFAVVWLSIGGKDEVLLLQESFWF